MYNFFKRITPSPKTAKEVAIVTGVLGLLTAKALLIDTIYYCIKGQVSAENPALAGAFIGLSALTTALAYRAGGKMEETLPIVAPAAQATR